MIDLGFSKKKRIENKEVFIFDFDGVVVDSLRQHYEHMKAVCWELEVHFNVALDEYLTSIGKKTSDFDNILDAYRCLLSNPGHYRFFYEKLGINYDENNELIDAIFKEYVNPDSLRVFEEMPELLSNLRNAGFKIGLVTYNYRPVVNEFLERNNLVFDYVVCSEDVSKGKPDPEGLEKCLIALSAEPSQAVYIGDAIFDAQAANDAGISFVGVGYGYTVSSVLEQYASVVVDSPETLKNTLLPS